MRIWKETMKGISPLSVDTQGGGRVFLTILLTLGHMTTVTTLPGVLNDTTTALDCTNDFDEQMFCAFDALNCSEHEVTLLSNDGHGETHCVPRHCDSGRCCCSVQMMLILGETHTASLRKGGKSVEDRIISISASIKPKTPTIISVDEVNGSFQVKWKTNMEGAIGDSLTANVTYHKKDDAKKVFQSVQPTTVDGLSIYEIPGWDLEPSTTYVVSVKSYIERSGKFSDSSKELEFTTPASPDALFLGIIISLSIAAVLITSVVFCCYVKLKSKWWDTVVKCSNPKLLLIRPYEQQLLKPELPITCAVCVEPLIPDDSESWWKGSLADTSSGNLKQSSGISTASSCLSYMKTEPADILASVHDALSKAFPNISPTSTLTTNLLQESNRDGGLLSVPFGPCDANAGEVKSGWSAFNNKTYSILISSCPPTIMTDSSEVRAPADMVCDSAYCPTEGDVVACQEQLAPACPLLNSQTAASSPMPTDMSYHQCNADSGGLSYAEDSGSSSISSGTSTTFLCDPVSRVEAGYESLDEGISAATKPIGPMEVAIKCDDNPCYGCVPAGSHSLPPLDDAYQAFQTLVGQPGAERKEHLDQCPVESFTKGSPAIPGFIRNVQGDQCLSELQRPFLSLISAAVPVAVMTESGYQGV
uniref:Fibronectin type-III domain-containing protein n=1 Tax=Scophthalmus maximus TaxID=52904 RepID=A0A8D2ZZE2_SCOMX